MDGESLALAIAATNVALIFYLLGFLTGKHAYRKPTKKKRKGRHHAD